MKILALDIETQYMVGGFWGIWNQNIAINQLMETGSTISWAARWLGPNGKAKGSMMFRSHYDDDFLDEMWTLLDEADVVLTYNGRRFDLPTLNREFVKAGMPPPSPYKHLDLLETVKKVFKLPSNKLQFVAEDLQIGSKLAHEGWDLWRKCREGDEAAWRKMERYNKQDVSLLIKLYNRIKPWISNHPNAGLYQEGNACTCSTCGSKNVQQRGYYHTQAAVFKRWVCNDCGDWSRSRWSDTTTEKRKSNLVAAV